MVALIFTLSLGLTWYQDSDRSFLIKPCGLKFWGVQGQANWSRHIEDNRDFSLGLGDREALVKHDMGKEGELMQNWHYSSSKGDSEPPGLQTVKESGSCCRKHKVGTFLLKKPSRGSQEKCNKTVHTALRRRKQQRLKEGWYRGSRCLGEHSPCRE